jgi:hypothetical protein
MVTDLIIEASAPQGLVKKALINPFLQRWPAPTGRNNPGKLNNDIQRMIKVAKKYNTNLAAIQLTPNLSAQLPT